MKPINNPFIRRASLAAPVLLSLSTAFAATYQWSGTNSTDWTVAGNWASGNPFNTQNITAGPAPTGTGAHRLNVNNRTASELVYTAALGTTTYNNGTARGLVIGSGTGAQGGSGTFRITGGKFSTVGASGGDIIGNNAGNTGTLIIDGGEYEASATVGMGIGGGPTSIITINSGLATVPTLNLNNTTGTINLNGGTLAMNQITRTAGTNTINFNGGTLRARQTTAGFIPAGISSITTAGTSTIDTNGFDVAINSAISGSGTLNKINAGKLTLSAANTFTGSLDIQAGSVALAPATVTTFAGTFSGAGALEIGGTGRVDLPTNHSHTGGTTVLGGASIGGEGSVPGALTFAGTSSLFFNPSTTGTNEHFRANTINASAGTISIVPTTGSSGSNIVVMEAPGGITGSIGVNFLGSSRVSLAFNNDNTQLLANYTPATITWKGNDVTNPTFWNTGLTLNWDNSGTPDAFSAGDNVIFDDSATTFNVALQATQFPGNMTFNHSTNAYTLSGAAIGGAGNLTKSGSGTLTINTANSYTGSTSISAGRVVLGTDTALGAVTGGTTVSGTGVLDINGRNLSTEVITISGDGDGNGALVNDGAQQINATGRLVLAGNASIGGLTRWDLRNSFPTLDMGGFALTKRDVNYVGLVGVTVSNPGNIDVTAGTFSIQTATVMGGSASNTIQVRSGATLSSWQTADPVSWSLQLEDVSTLRSESAALATQNIWSGPVSIAENGLVVFQADATMSVTGAVSGTNAAINKTGAGVVFVAGSNSYTGATTISGGGWVAQNPSSLGTTDGDTTVISGRVELDNVTVTGEAINIAGDGANFFGALQGRSGSSVWTGNVSVDANNTRIGAQIGSTLEVSGTISSALNHSLIFRPADPTATVIVSGANTYPGSTIIAGGPVVVSSLNSVSGGSPSSSLGAPTTEADGRIQLSLGTATGTLRYVGTGETTDRVVDLLSPTTGGIIEQAGTGVLKFTSNFTSSTAGNKTLILTGSTAGTGELAGAVVDHNATNLTSLRKEGSGTWTLSGTNPYSGATQVIAGTLALAASGSIDASTSLTIAAGAELDTTAKSSHSLPATVSIGIDGDTDTVGRIDAAGQALDIDAAAVTLNVVGTLDAPAYVLANYGTLSGTPAFASITPPAGYTVDYAYNGGTQIALVSEGTDYDDWMALFPSITDPNDKLGTADPDGDGLTNSDEYAFGLAPNSGSSVNPILVPLDKGSATFSYQRRSTTGLDYTIWTSPDLATWTQDLTAVQTPGTPDANNVQTVSVTLSGAPLAATRLFVRVEAE
ncbi:MAG: autotransporter-associated beta strand repeat-containing protein [Akkermansiaceae bacterium]|nr:autotransporter-associated beta strand repeat-containing protein [Akkermansiaceae bacterium]